MKNIREFYVYTHARTDGSIFYVGKGYGRRAWDFAPSRRTAWHRNIVDKHGIANIIVTIHKADDERSAFEMERQMISDLRDSGIELINLTEGGEGCSGRAQSEKQLVAFATGRKSWDERGLSQASRDAILAGAAAGRVKVIEWNKSEAGKAHHGNMIALAAQERASRTPRTLVCGYCDSEFNTISLKNVKWCSKSCGGKAQRLAKKFAQYPNDRYSSLFSIPV